MSWVTLHLIQWFPPFFCLFSTILLLHHLQQTLFFFSGTFQLFLWRPHCQLKLKLSFSDSNQTQIKPSFSFNSNPLLATMVQATMKKSLWFSCVPQFQGCQQQSWLQSIIDTLSQVVGWLRNEITLRQVWQRCLIMSWLKRNTNELDWTFFYFFFYSTRDWLLKY